MWVVPSWAPLSKGSLKGSLTGSFKGSLKGSLGGSFGQFQEELRASGTLGSLI